MKQSAEDPLEPQGSWGLNPRSMFRIMVVLCIPILVFGVSVTYELQAWAIESQDPESDDSTSKPQVQAPRKKPAKSSITSPLHDEKSERSIRKGVRFLVRKQNGVGAISSSYPVAVTSLAGMALLGAGAEYGLGPEGKALEKAVDYLISPLRTDERGYLEDRGETRSRMHGHTYAILFLSQVIGQVPTPQREEQLRKVIRAGVDLILSSQTNKGGWGYDPDDPLDEASLTVCCLQALRAAKESGFNVPPDPISKAIQYLQECCSEDGSFKYSLTRSQGRTSFEITAASISTMDAAGEYAADERSRGLDYMKKMIEKKLKYRQNFFKAAGNKAAGNFPFYGNFYVGQVLQQSRGELWHRWSHAIWPQLIDLQGESGSWESRYGEEYATAMALLILELPLGYLPLYDR